MRKVLIYLLGVITCLCVCGLLPIIPIQQSPVIPQPVYSLDFVSIVEFMNPFRLGVWYRMEWYTFISILALFIAGGVSGVIGIWIARVLMKKMSKTNKKAD